MTEQNTPFKMELDKEQFNAHVQDSIKSIVTSMVTQALPRDGLDEMLKSAFHKSWMRDDKDNWLESNARDAMRQAVWTAVREAVDASDMQAKVTAATNEILASDEFNAALLENTRKAVMKTTFYVSAIDESEG